MPILNDLEILIEWIAHGLMDSIVDSFFPYLEVIEKEVLDIERSVFSAGDRPAVFDATPSPTKKQVTSGSDITATGEKAASVVLSEKGSLLELARASAKSIAPKPHFMTPTNLPLLVRRARRIVGEKIALIPRFKSIDPKTSGQPHPSSSTVHRMAKIRRLVTSLTRFLAVKSEVVAQVKKRLLSTGEWSLGTGTEDDLDVFVYMGDVQGTFSRDFGEVRH